MDEIQKKVGFGPDAEQLKRVRPLTPEASNKTKRKEKNIREIAKQMLAMHVSEKNSDVLETFGITEKSDQTYAAAIVVKLLAKALTTADVNAIKTLLELTGDLNKFGGLIEDKASEIESQNAPLLILPDNGRDKKTGNFIKPQAGPQTQFMCSPADIVIYGGAAGGGKSLAVSEKVLTPTGYRMMGELKVGDLVMTPKGYTSRITGVFPQGVLPVYRVTTIDGGELIVSGDHLWQCRITKESSHKWKIRTTEEMMDLINDGKRLCLPMTLPLSFEPKGNVQIKPYTLGVMLGDGCMSTGRVIVSSPEDEIYENILKDGYNLHRSTRNDKDYAYQYMSLSKADREYLKVNNMFVRAEDKHIPEEYLFAPIDDRLSLLQGLMDTDGHADERGHVEYCTVSERLAKDIQWLVRSLGGKATIRKRQGAYKLDGIRHICQMAYIVYIRLPNNEECFRLPRKKERCRGRYYNGGHGSLNMRIKSIEPCGEEECQCIKIEDPDGLFVANDFIVTHNTYALLLEGLRHKDVKGFGAVIFRKNFTQVTAQGGLWDASHKVYDPIPDAKATKTPKLHWDFQSGARLNFAHLESDDDLSSWQGTEICFLGFDELTHFSKKIFLYMLSRNRSTCGVKPYVRATCNPDADSWVADFISWWIDPDTGYPIPERSGLMRYMCVTDDTFHWGDDPETLSAEWGLNPEDCKTVTFIASSLHDNKVLMETDPGYLANLKALTEVDRERLLMGNWKIKSSAGMYFKRLQITSDNMLTAIPNDIIKIVRGWDLAATEEAPNKDADWTAGVLMGKRKNGLFVILDVVHARLSAGMVRTLVLQTAVMDRQRFGLNYTVRLPIDPGQAGKDQAQNYVKALAGFNVKTVRVTGSKETRCTPLAAQWQNGNVQIMVADWNEPYFIEMESFPESKHDDMVDASSDAFNELTSGTDFNIDALL